VSGLVFLSEPSCLRRDTGMAFFPTMISIPELQALDAKELDILREAIRNEITTNPDIRRILQAKARAVYDELRPPPPTGR
jgi:hypothetical protein